MAENPFDLTDKVAVITGGYGVIGGTIARGLAAAGASVVILGRNGEKADATAAQIGSELGDTVRTGAVVADATDEEQLKRARDAVVGEFGRLDILINTAGGNVARARSDGRSIFDLPLDAFDEVVKLNLHGTVYPTLVFGSAMADAGKGSVVNISSMASIRYLSGAMGYAVAKAATDNFTRWMAADVARIHGSGLRVNAIAPGFFITTQNRGVLLNEDGSYTNRSKDILRMTPAGRFGDPTELVGAAVWLCSDAASFVTGTVIPIDGGFSIDGGV